MFNPKYEPQTNRAGYHMCEDFALAWHEDDDAKDIATAFYHYGDGPTEPINEHINKAIHRGYMDCNYVMNRNSFLNVKIWIVRMALVNLATV